MNTEILAWHFVGNALRDGSPVPDDGELLRYYGPLVICQSGLHASRHPFDALQYAPGPILCRVKCSGEMIEQNDKLVCRERTIISRLDATEGLQFFARMQALSVAHLWEPSDIVLDYLMTGAEAAREAAEAARAARDAAQAAAWTAAQWAAWTAAQAAQAAQVARDAAQAAARAAAQWAARDAAQAARDAAEAARDAAQWAARDAARDAARAAWNELVFEAFGETP